MQSRAPIFEVNDRVYAAVCRALDDPDIDDNDFGEFGPTYLLSNENLTDSMAALDLRGRDVLTVAAGSGDWCFNALAYGARSVAQFDISLFTKFLFEIKYQAVTHLSHAEYIEFMMQDGENAAPDKFFNASAASKFENTLSRSARELLRMSRASKHLRYWLYRLCNCGALCGIEANYSIDKNPYLFDSSVYNEVKKRLKSSNVPEFLTTDVRHLHRVAHGSYDIMYFSNIPQYFGYRAQEQVESFYQTVIRPLAPKLNPDGQMAIYSYYRYGDAMQTWRQKAGARADICAKRLVSFEETKGFTSTSDMNDLIVLSRERLKVK